MSLTRANCEAELVDRAGTLLTLVGKDGATVDGTNVSLNGPLREALLSLDVTPQAFIVADVDFTPVAAVSWPQLFDVAELRTLRTIANALTKVDTKVGMAEQKLDQIRQGVNARIADLTTRVRDSYGVGLATLAGASVSLDFAETLDANGCPLP